MSCGLLFLLLRFGSLRDHKVASPGLLALLSGLACIEKLGAIMNTVSVERDWVVMVAQGDNDRLCSKYEDVFMIEARVLTEYCSPQLPNAAHRPFL